MKQINKILEKKETTLLLPLLVAVVVSLQNYLQGINHFWGSDYTFYNNYVIFKFSFLNLVENKNLYILHLDNYADLYKYSPAFAVFMAPFAYLPDLVGLFLWNTLNCVIFYVALSSLVGSNIRKLIFFLGFTVLELVLTTQSSQSNALITGLIILAFSYMEKGKFAAATFCLIAGTFIKLFAVVGILLFVFYSKKFRAFLFLCLWTVFFILLPLAVVNPSELMAQYKNWFQMLSNDHATSIGMSVFTIVASLFGNVNKITVLLIGTCLLLLPLLNFKRYSEYQFRVWYLAAILIWIVIFNHKGESPTYIIAMTGCAIWGAYAAFTKKVKFTLLLTWVFTSLIKTDIVPPAAKAMLNLNVINALMPTVVFFIILFSLLEYRKRVSFRLTA